MKTFRYVSSAGTLILDMAHGFLIQKPEGIDTLSVSHSQAQGIGQVGSTVQASSVQSRPVIVNGRLTGAFQPENKNRLLSVVRPDLPGKLYCDDFYLNVVVSATPAISALRNNAQFQFSLLAAYPYWQRDENAKATLSGVAKRFKFPWKIRAPYRFGEAITAQFININNSGQVPIPFTVTFSAVDTVVNPRLTDAGTNNYLLLNRTMEAGEKLVVEISHERVYVNSSVAGECRGALDLSSKFYRLAVGDNVIKPDADSGKANLQVDIDYATEVVGIAL